ncbi:glycerol-3-phosphate dehydrogenase [Eggerthella sp. YY7918]|nr:glycerol-3-phosphate dehydrogenase [Eggerthella sp. YY7918]
MSPGRISQMLTSGQLEAYQNGGKRMVTIASVNERKANPPAPHRTAPPKAPASRLPLRRGWND